MTEEPRIQGGRMVGAFPSGQEPMERAAKVPPPPPSPISDRGEGDEVGEDSPGEQATTAADKAATANPTILI